MQNTDAQTRSKGIKCPRAFVDARVDLCASFFRWISSDRRGGSRKKKKRQLVSQQISSWACVRRASSKRMIIKSRSLRHTKWNQARLYRHTLGDVPCPHTHTHTDKEAFSIHCGAHFRPQTAFEKAKSAFLGWSPI